jgi:hypothetical protein
MWIEHHVAEPIFSSSKTLWNHAWSIDYFHSVGWADGRQFLLSDVDDLTAAAAAAAAEQLIQAVDLIVLPPVAPFLKLQNEFMRTRTKHIF